MAFFVYLSLAAFFGLILHRIYVLLVQTSSVVSSKILSEQSTVRHDKTDCRLSITTSRVMQPTSDTCSFITTHSESDSVPPSPGPNGLVASQYDLTDSIRTDIAALPGAGYGSYVYQIDLLKLT